MTGSWLCRLGFCVLLTTHGESTRLNADPAREREGATFNQQVAGTDRSTNRRASRLTACPSVLSFSEICAGRDIPETRFWDSCGYG